MKKIIEILGLIFGTLGVFIIANSVAIKYGIHAFGWEQVVDIFVEFLTFAMSLGYLLLILVLIWFPIYKFFDFSFINAQEAWEEMPKYLKLWFALALLYVLVCLYVGK